MLKIRDIFVHVEGDGTTSEVVNQQWNRLFCSYYTISFIGQLVHFIDG
jgi:hypothetical protein